MRNYSELVVAGRRVLLRVDFNVPLDENGEITDDTRIRRALPTIQGLLATGARLIVCSHLGRPGGKIAPAYSLAPVARRLAMLVGRPVGLADDCIGPGVEELAGSLVDGDILMLENLRFHSEETAGDDDFAADLAALADVYVNDAFAVSHRAHASVAGVAGHFAEKGAGTLLQQEMDFFHKAFRDPARPLVVLIGGAKVSSKLTALRNMLTLADTLLIGGAMANTFLKSRGVEVGSSLVEDDLLATAASLLAEAEERGVKVLLPSDVVVAESFSPEADHGVCPVAEIPREGLALDIGPATVTSFAGELAGAGTIVWNGPMGAFEMEPFSHGTMDLVARVTACSALGIVGGGDTNAAVHQAGLADKVGYMSTGGGAFLALMEGKKLPGVVALS